MKVFWDSSAYAFQILMDKEKQRMVGQYLQLWTEHNILKAGIEIPDLKMKRTKLRLLSLSRNRY